MNRTATGLCIAAAFGLVASMGAQTPTTTTAGQTAATSTHDSKDISLTGCLQRGPDGKFILANARMDSDMHPSASTGTTTGSTAGTTGTSNPPTGTTAGAATGSSAGAMDAASTWALEGGQDLEKHVGHKVQVTGRAAKDTMSKDDAAAAATTATGSTATTGTTGTTGAAAGEQRRSDRDMKNSGQRLDVKSVKMIAASCS
jgi:hypothetical protein